MKKMKVEIYRPMRANEQNQPELGTGSKKLGIREYEVVLNEDSMVVDKNGLSVATSLNGVAGLPRFLLPFEPQLLPLTLSKDAKTKLFQYLNGQYEPFEYEQAISKELKLKKKPRKKGLGFVSPKEPITIADFKNAIDETQDKWNLCDWETIVESINELNGY